MASRIGSLYVDLTMNSRGFVAGMGQAQTATTRAAASINRNLGLSQRTVNNFAASTGNKSFRPYAIIAASRAYETANDRVNLLRGSLLALTAVAGGFGAALGTNLLARYADTAINLNNQLRTVSTSTANLTAVQTELENVAERSRSSLQATITLYARTARASEQLGLSQEKLLRVTETIQKSFSIGGATGAEAQGAAIQLSQGIASDRFSGEEFRSVSENAPVLLRGMAESLSVTIGKLRELAHAGELTADVVTQAILRSSARIDAEFGQTVISIDRAITHVDNKLLEFIGDTDKAYGVTTLMSRGIVTFGNSLDQIIPPLIQIAALIGTVFLARNKGALGGGLGGLIGGGIGLATGGIDGGIMGAALGGFAGFAASRKDKDGLGFIGRIKADASASREEVVRLTSATKDLRDATWRARQDMRTATAATKGDPIAHAPKSAQSAIARELLAVQKLDQRKIALLDEQRASYQKLATVASQITPRAAKLVDTQLKAEAKLNDVLQKQASIRQGIAAIGADRKASAAVEGRSTADTADEAKQRVRAQKFFTAAVAAEAKQREVIAERQAKISTLASETDRKAAAERMVIGRQIMDQTNALNSLDEKRVAQTRVLAEARTAAEQAGASAARTNLQQATQNFRGFSQALGDSIGRLDLARKAASGFSIGMRAVGRSVGSLMGLFGGPWGVAITGASLLFAQFAVSAQEQAQQIANAKRLIDEVLQDGPTESGNKAGSLLSRQFEAIDANIKTVETGAAQAVVALQRLFNESGTRDSTGVQGLVNAWKALVDLPINGKIDELQTLSERFVGGEIDVFQFRDALGALKAEVADQRFDEMADQVLELGNVLSRNGAAVAAYRAELKMLRASAENPINVVIRQTFDGGGPERGLNEMPINAPRTNATKQFAIGLGYTRGLDKELETLRLVGEARKRAEYTDEQIKKAEKDGVNLTDAVRKRIAAFVDEKIALEARDAALKKSDKDNPYEKAVQSIQEKVAAQQLENQMLGQTTYAIEREKAIRDLANAAIEAKIALTPSLYSAILSEAEAYAVASQAAEDLKKQREAEKEQFEFYKGTFSSFFVDLKNNLMEGASLWDTFANAAYNALNKIADRALGLAADGIFDLIFGAITGGLTGGLGGGMGGGKGFIPGMTGPSLFDQGGFTGIGGKYQPAGIVHRGEYVFDAAAVKRIGVPALEGLRGYANGGAVGGVSAPANDWAANDNITINLNTTINAPAGADQAALQRLLDKRDENIRRTLPKMIADARRRGEI